VTPEAIRELRRSLGCSRAKFAIAVVRAYRDERQREDFEDDEWSWRGGGDLFVRGGADDWPPDGDEPTEVTSVTVYRWEKGLRCPQGKHLEGLLALDRRARHDEIKHRVRQEINDEESRLLPRRSSPQPLTSEEVRLIRQTLGATQAQAAAMVGVQRNTWARWERGERMPHPTIQRIIRWLPRPESQADPRPERRLPGPEDDFPAWVVQEFRPHGQTQ
jgi:DNA-binding transcriptional regulator YiaG